MNYTSNSSFVRFVERNWRVGVFLGMTVGSALFALYLAISFVFWIFTETTQQRVQREGSERYQTWKVALNKHVDVCIAKHGKNHFGPMLGFVGAGGGGCGIGGRHNGVACTSNSTFQNDLKVMWDGAHTRNVCVVWKPSRVTWRGADRYYSGVTAHAEDNSGERISIAFTEKKLQ